MPCKTRTQKQSYFEIVLIWRLTTAIKGWQWETDVVVIGDVNAYHAARSYQYTIEFALNRIVFVGASGFSLSLLSFPILCHRRRGHNRITSGSCWILMRNRHHREREQMLVASTIYRLSSVLIHKSLCCRHHLKVISHIFSLSLCFGSPSGDCLVG
jgi:hypothetical protein